MQRFRGSDGRFQQGGADLAPVGQGGCNIGKDAQLDDGGNVILPQHLPEPPVTLAAHSKQG